MPRCAERVEEGVAACLGWAKFSEYSKNGWLKDIDIDEKNLVC